MYDGGLNIPYAETRVKWIGGLDPARWQSECLGAEVNIEMDLR